MNIEQKAKAYDEALKWMRELYPGLHGATKEDAEHYFPELRESDDERARKAALEGIEYLERKLGWDAIGDTDILDVKEYLEKQKEQKPAQNISQLTVQGKSVYKICPRCKEPMVRDDSKVYTSMPPQYCYECPKCGEMVFDTVMYNNPKMDEQKPAEYTSDSALQKIKRAIMDYKKLSEHYKDTEENLYQYYGGKANGLQLALIYFGYENEQPMEEQKPTDDKAFEEWIDDYWKHNKVNNPDSYDKGDEIQFDERGFKNFCRGIRNMYSNQQSAEWSEEDETHLGWIIECFDSWKYQVPEFADQYQSAINWLKSLRPQPHWKPSKEQLMALMDALRVSLSEPDMRIPYEPLSALYKQLKNL